MGIMGAIIQMNFKRSTLRREDASAVAKAIADEMEGKLSNPETDSEQAFQGAARKYRRDACSTRRRKDTGGTPAPLGLLPKTGAGTDARQRVPTKAFPKAKGGPIYVSAKRTHRFGVGKVGLSDWGTMGSDGKNLGISVGSFWKTNPPGGVY